MDDYIFVRRNNCYEKVYIQDIHYIEADQGYISIKTPRQEYTLSDRLNRFLEKITHPKLVQVHRSYIVNIDHVTKVEKPMHLFIGGKGIPIGKTYRDAFFKRFSFF